MSHKMLVGAVSLNNRHLTNVFLDSLYRSGQEKECDSMIIDNGSTEDVMDLQHLYPNTKFYRNNVNIGVAPAWNQILRTPGYDYYAICNNDLYLGYNFVSSMTKFLDEHAEAGIVSPYVQDCRIDEALKVQTRYDAVRQLFVNEAQIVAALDYTYQPWADFNHNEDGFDGYVNWVEMEYRGQVLPQVLGSCFILRRQTIEEVGYLDESFTENNVGVSEDFDICRRIANTNKWQQIMNKACAVHHFSMQTRGNPNITQQYYGVDPARWEAKRHENTAARWKGDDLRPK